MIAAWLLAALIAFPFQSKLQALASDESDAFKDSGAESTQVDDIIDTRFKGGERDHRGGRSTRATTSSSSRTRRIAADALALCNAQAIPDIVRVITPVQLACGELPPITPPQSSRSRRPPRTRRRS